eukprot:scaffold919_cov153-Ochromonas_danica.AAC.23
MCPAWNMSQDPDRYTTRSCGLGGRVPAENRRIMREVVRKLDRLAAGSSPRSEEVVTGSPGEAS